MISLVWEKFTPGRKKCTRFRVAAYSIRVLGTGELEWYRCKLPPHLTDMPEAVKTGHRVTWSMSSHLANYCRQRGIKHHYDQNFRKKIGKGDNINLSDVELLACLNYEPEEAP